MLDYLGTNTSLTENIEYVRSCRPETSNSSVQRTCILEFLKFIDFDLHLELLRFKNSDFL